MNREKLTDHNNEVGFDALVMPYDGLKDRLIEQGSLTSWHWGDDLLMFADKFYRDTIKLRDIQKKFTYYMRKLVKNGYAKKGYKMGLGAGGVNQFGCRFQTTWDLYEGYKREA